MFRLSDRAFEILKAEVLRCSGSDLAGKVQREIALKRLEKLQGQPGNPLTPDELRETISDLFPNFSAKVLMAAAQANHPRSPLWTQVKVGAIALASLAGSLWILNLPYPMIRYPVARVAPLILLPSFMSMDYHYRQVTALVEQSDQLINQATSAVDFDLGATKVRAAQQHLDALPVWFLGYYPQFYCSWFQCGWRFTLDEFQQARKDVARMEAKLFQESNAQTQLEQAEQMLGEAKQQYQAAPKEADKRAAIAQWQQAIDTLQQLPRETLAGRTAQTRLTADQRDFQQVVGFTADQTQSASLIQAARNFAEIAQQSTTDQAHSVAEWEEIHNQWAEAIQRLNRISEREANYPEAQKLLAQYSKQQGEVHVRLKTEQDSVQALDQAERLQQSLIANADTLNTNRMSSQLQAIESLLNKVSPGTTVYSRAKEMLVFVRKRLK